MPNQALLYTGRVVACTQLPAMMHLARDLCGGQLCVTPGAASFRRSRDRPAGSRSTIASAAVDAEDRRRLFAFARDLLNSDYAGHRLTFQLFAQSPAFAHLLAVYNNYDFDGPADLVRRYAGLSEPRGEGRRERATDHRRRPRPRAAVQHARHLSRAAASATTSARP